MKPKPLKLSSNVLLLLLILSIMAFFGFKPGSKSTSNTIEWIEGKGLVFDIPSRAYTPAYPIGYFSTNDSISINISLIPHYFATPRFGIILQLFSEDSGEILTLAQWDKSVMFLSGSDYSNEKREPKIYAPLGETVSEVLIHIDCHENGTEMTINDRKVFSNKYLTHPFSSSDDQMQLILGNGYGGRSPWKGVISSLNLGELNAYYKKHNPLSKEELIWQKNIATLKKQFLQIPTMESISKKNMLIDVVLNILGFIPLAYVLMRICGNKWLLVITLIFSFSLSIEISQVWIAGRNSSSLDLLLNTLGGIIGIVLTRTINID